MVNEKPFEATIIFDNGSEELLVTPMGSNLFRLEETSFVDDATYHDVIEAEFLNDSTLRFARLASRSELKTSTFTLTKPQMESPFLPGFLDKVMAAGGNWERLFEGLLLLHLPPALEAPLLEEFNALLKEHGAGTQH